MRKLETVRVNCPYYNSSEPKGMLYCICASCNSLETENKLILALVPKVAEGLEGIANRLTAVFLLNATPAAMTIIWSIPLASTLSLKRTIFQVSHYVFIANNCNIATEVISKLHAAFFLFLF